MRMSGLRPMGALFILLLTGFLGGCNGATAGVDPWEKTNRFLYAVDDGLDKIAFKPLSDAYVQFVPKPIRMGLGNAFDNLGYGNVILNDFLQGKWDQGWGDAGRMAVNSTVGVAGIFDVAGRWGLPSHDNDFGITLGKWGFESGPYIMLPLFGPSSVRDVPEIPVEFATDPTTWLSMPIAVQVSLYLAEAVDTRSRADKEMRFRSEAAIDPYVFTRDAYLQYRAAQVREGKPAPGGAGSIYDEDYGPTTAPATAPASGPAPTTTRP